jgi:hypothetical protein
MITSYFDDKFTVELPSREIDPTGIFKKDLVNSIFNEYPWLSVNGVDEPFAGKGVNYAGPNNVITFGTSKTHDVDWLRSADYARSKGYGPIYNYKNWYKVLDKLDTFAKNRNPYKTDSYTYTPKENSYVISFEKYYSPRVEVYRDFILVGNTVIPRIADITPYYNRLSIVERKVYDLFIITLL